MHRPSTTVGILAVTQVVSWGSLYYAFTILAPGIRRDLGLAPELAFGAFSWALLVAGVAAAPVGLLLDRHGGRTVMAAGSFLCFLGLAWLGRCTDVVSYYAAWTLIGLAMALTLYEAAFATIQRRLAAGDSARQAISTLTLFGGFASTLSWPLTAWLDTSYGWRATCLSYGIVQLAVCLPLHLCLGADAAAPAHAGAPRGHTLAEAVRHPAFWTLALAFAVNAFVFSAMAVHLIPLFERLGQAKTTAVLLAALIGPMQVAGRVGEMAFARHTAPQTVGKLTFAMLPAALAIIALGGAQAWSVAAFCVLYGLSNGILTILRGALPRALFGREHYGAIAGAMAGPALLAKAAGPLIAATLLRRADGPALLLSVLLAMSLASFAFYLRAVAPDKTFDKRPA